MSLTYEDLELLEKYRDDPVGFFEVCLGRTPWEKQREILQSVIDYPETFVASANGIGKTDVAGGLVPYWITTRRGICITTANTWKQVETVLWERIKLLIKQAPVSLGLRPVATKIQVDENWFAIGLSTNEPDRFQGYHDAEVLVIVEEAGGMNVESLWDALEGCLTGSRDRLLAIGNPTMRGTVFHRRITTPDPDRNVIVVSAFDTPNLREGRVVYEGMITVERVERWRRQWGEDDPRWQSRVLGLFPDESDTSMYPQAWLEAAFDYEGPSLETGNREAGLDVARYGPDLNALALRDGGTLLGAALWGGIDLMKTTGRLVRCLRDGSLHGPEYDGDAPAFGQPVAARVDTDGLGSGVFDRAAELVHARPELQGIELFEFKASAATTDPENFHNFKTEAYWSFREKLRTRSVDLSALTTEQREILLGQAAAVTYDIVDSSGAIKVKPKKELKKGSADQKFDLLEALIICFLDEEVDGTDNSTFQTRLGPYADPDPWSGGTWEEQPEGGASDEVLYVNVGLL